MQFKFQSTMKMASKFLFISQILLGYLQVIMCDRTAHLFDSIYQFGDSLTDTGNLLIEDPNFICSKPPHGIDLYDHPTGRCSNGLLMIDYYAKAFGLPLINPYMAKGADFSNGVNFAVSGATALDPTILAEKIVTSNPSTNNSLSIQLQWFKDHLRSICSSTSECKQKLSRSLILVGEIGANDYNYHLYYGNPIYDLYPLVPLVIDTIKNVVQEIIDVGATLLVVPGDFPIGCMPIYRFLFKSNNTEMYDELHCLKDFNEFAVFHNNHLQRAIKQLQHENPHVTVIYGDNYHSFRQLLQNVVSLGFEKDEMFMPCCGKVEDKYNCDGSKGAPWCEDRRKRVFWDGTHPTQEAYNILVNWSLTQMFNITNSPSCSHFLTNHISFGGETCKLI